MVDEDLEKQKTLELTDGLLPRQLKYSVEFANEGSNSEDEDTEVFNYPLQINDEDGQCKILS